MAKFFSEFTIRGETNGGFSIGSLGIELSSPGEVVQLGLETGMAVSGWDNGSRGYQLIIVEEKEGSVRLMKLYEILARRYDVIPGNRRLKSPLDTGREFGVFRKRVYAKSEIDSANLLSICRVKRIAGGHGFRGPEESFDQYVIAGKPRANVRLGVLSPFLEIVVGCGFKEELEKYDLKGLRFEKVRNTDLLWKLNSELELPRSENLLVDQDGVIVDVDSWSSKHRQIFFDDSDGIPVELKYGHEKLSKLPDFDIALTRERERGAKELAVRTLVVSQRFRGVLTELGVTGVDYALVKTV